MRKTRSSSSNGKRTTIKDVARVAGISTSTVSNALNGRTDSMTEETLRRIENAMNSLNYRPSSLARGLVTHHTSTVGLILSEIETPLFLQAIHYIEPIARQAGYNVLLSNAHDLDDEKQAVNLLLEKQVDGIIFISTSEYRDDSYLLDLQESRLPLVLINRPNHDASCNQLSWDNAGGVSAAVDHLVELGHQRIAMLRGPASRHSSNERVRGYQMGLERNGLAFNDEYIGSGDFTSSSAGWQQSTLELLKLADPPTAIIASDDIVAAVLLRTLQNAGLSVPRDVSVIGIDDQPFCTYLNPSLTTVQLPVIEAGKRAIDLLLMQFAGDLSEPVQVVLPCPLIVRESSGHLSKPN